MSGFPARHEFGASLFVEQFSGSVSWCISAQLALCKEDMPRKQMLTVSHIVVAHFCRFKTWFLKDEFGDLEIQGQHSSSSKILAVANNLITVKLRLQRRCAQDQKGKTNL